MHGSERNRLKQNSLLLHEPAVGDDQGLTGQRVRGEGGEKQRRLGDILDGRELAIDGFLQHDILDDVLLADPKGLGLFRNLLLDQGRADKAGTDDVGAHAMRGAFLGDNPGEADQAMLGGDIRRFEHRGFLGVDRAYVDIAISLPIPLAAPVTTAALSLRRMGCPSRYQGF